MSDNVGVWIDHGKAVIVEAGSGTVRTLDSELDGHPRYTGEGGGYPGLNSSQRGGGEKRYEERWHQELNRYYDAVIAQLGRPRSLLIVGPGEAKHELKARLHRAAAPEQPVIAIDSADRLTESQLVARVKAHFDR